MAISLRPVSSSKELRQFVLFPWKVNQDDPNWVPPLITERLARLDEQKNPFWRTAERKLWIAWLENKIAGTIAVFIDHHSNEIHHVNQAFFGFFECVNDPEVAGSLLTAAEDWARHQGMTHLRGPYNPSQSDECGILVEGFDSRPAILESHNPPYYRQLFETAGFRKQNDILARLYRRQPGETLEQVFPEKIRRVAERVGQRSDLLIRPVNIKAWDAEIQMAGEIYNLALGTLPEYTPIPAEEFARFAASFRPLVDARFALVAELKGKPVGFALALPDINEALKPANGRMDLPGMLKFWWYSRRLSRISFKILMMLPETIGRGIEAVLIYRIAAAIWAQGYQEVDMSLTGEENTKSMLIQEHIGFNIYRRYRIFEKELN